MEGDEAVYLVTGESKSFKRTINFIQPLRGFKGK